MRKSFELCEVPDECLGKLEYDTKLAVAVSRLHALNTPAISQKKIYCFTRARNIYSYSVAMPIKLDFQLLPQINYIIRQLLEFGLIERWNKLSQAIATNNEIKRSFKAAKESGGGSSLVILTVAHIMGAIMIMCFGHFVAMLAFILEVIVHRKVKNGSRSKIWLMLYSFLQSK